MLQPILRKSLFLLFLLAFGTTACSGIVKRDIPRLDTPNVDWVKFGTLDEYGCIWFFESRVPKYEVTPDNWSLADVEKNEYVLNTQATSVHLYPHYTPNYRLTWIGPIVIPIIPKFLFSHRDIAWQLSLRIDIQTQNMSTVSMDVSRIKAFTEEGKPLPLSVVYLNSSKLDGIPKQPLKSAGNMVFSLAFNATYPELDHIHIDLGDIYIDDKPIPLPPFKIRKNSEYRYAPLILGS